MLSLKYFCLIFLQFPIIYCAIDEIKIYENEMYTQMELHVISQALALLETESDLNAVAKKLENEMNSKYGTSWICFTGINSNFTGVNFNPKAQTFIWFSFKEKHFVVFQQSIEITVTTKYTTADSSYSVSTITETVTVIPTDQSSHVLDPALCKTEGFFRNPHNCSLYYRCFKEGDRLILYDFRSKPCNFDLVFDEKTQVCAAKENTEPCHNKPF
jgi:hypothetical protein